MSSWSLIYYNTQGISSANDLIQIMNIGNQLYSSLSQLARRAHLMQSELPTALNVFDTDYQLEYSESYSGTVHQEIAIEGYQYCTSLPRAFESLIFESYTNFILTVGCITVIVIWGSKYLILMQEICMVEGSLKVRVLLEVPSLDSLVHYFQSIHNNDIFEVRGVQIENIQNRMVSQNSLKKIINFNLSCAVPLYSLCYSIAMFKLTNYSPWL